MRILEQWTLHFHIMHVLLFLLKNLKREMEEAERRTEQLMELRREEQVSTAFSVDALSCCILKHLLKLVSAGEREERTQFD